MPNRILRDWTDSEAINSLSALTERHFTRIIMKVDDFGRLPANPKIMRPLMYPFLLDQVRETDVQRWTAECAKAGLIRLYEVAGKQYLIVEKFDQRIRADKSKYPDPTPESWLTPDRIMTGKCQSDDSPPRTKSLDVGDRRKSLSKSLKDVTTKATTLRIQKNGKDKDSELVSDIIAYCDDEKSRAMFITAESNLGEGLLRELFGELKMRVKKGVPIENKGAYLTTMILERIKERVPIHA